MLDELHKQFDAMKLAHATKQYTQKNIPTFSVQHVHARMHSFTIIHMNNENW